MAPQTDTYHTKIAVESGDSDKRMVVVRYYLDRPGYDIDHSSARLWRDPPATCTSADVTNFLQDQCIGDDGLIVEIYLDRFKSYMLLQACEADKMVFDFSSTSVQDPGILNIRLTDTSSGSTEDAQTSGVVQHHNCNTSPAGLFAFSMTVALESADALGRLVPNTVAPSFVLIWGPYAFWLSGLLQLIVGMFEVTRGNVYGATAFMAFGSFWLANGTRLILINYFPSDIPDDLLGSDPVGNFIRNVYIFGFACVLFKQTLIMNKLTSTLIVLLCSLMLATSLTGWSLAMEWIALIFGWMVSFFAFYAFTAEITNEVHQREVFNIWPWTPHSADELYGAAGRTNTLRSKATKLRTAHFGTQIQDVRTVRTALPGSSENDAK